jgi:hypothetical protein
VVLGLGAFSASSALAQDLAGVTIAENKQVHLLALRRAALAPGKKNQMGSLRRASAWDDNRWEKQMPALPLARCALGWSGRGDER